ncbi:UbiA family prenyltransferase [Modestobacter sp. VKM Ac-2984]|uniref:UbiA family prenyltransferase n=1 Tax=Modestobacter sp. VKM Ac-2984 TaxID=3004138 RepID=UPI0022AA8FBF|nr:UbiA family prenyltransferase [Modestobacter sp. VKM Ac-2984]MCZ2814948.1 UbiA family prenyltransferase [Modestobacter sp. VKM Ac-2984]
MTQRPAGLGVLHLLWAEARPVVQALFALRYAVGAVVGVAGAGVLRPAVVVGALAWVLLMTSIYLVNGVSDLLGDRANGSTRPLASGRLAVRVAVRTAGALAGAGLLLAACSGVPALLACALATAVLGWAYSVGPRPLKHTVAGTTVAAIGGGLLSYGAGVAAAGGGLTAPYAAVFLLLCAWMAVVGTSKDLGDREGDRLTGRRSLPVVAGHRTAVRVIAGGSLLLGLTALALAGVWPQLLAPAAALCLGGEVVAVLALPTPEGGPRQRRRRPYRAFMVTQYLANPLVVVSVLL